MTRIAPVRVCYNPRIYWFDALDFDLPVDAKVVVNTALGSELATVANPPFEATDAQLRDLKSPLRPIVRIATDEDIAKSRELEQRGLEAMPVFREMAAQTNEDMRPVAVRYLLEGGKAIFYFEAEERVDFRELVKKLAAEFHVRVDMRQIGVRDEARMIGGLGHCGQELCCARMGGNFNPVSIRMAKEQDLSLNPQKISGTCGRLMCCLRYEYEAYKDVNSRAPKKNATIRTPEGPAKVVDMNVPRETVTLKLEGENGKTVKVLLSDFDPPEARTPEERPRPRSIGEEAWEAAKQREAANDRFEASFLTSQFTREDKVGTAQAVHHERGGRNAAAANAQDSPRTSSRSGRGASKEREQAPDRKRRRRSTKIDAHGERTDTVGPSAENGKEKAGAVRPGQRSSALRNRSGEGAKQNGRDDKKTAKQRSGQGSGKNGQGASGQRRKGGSNKSGQKDAAGDQHRKQRNRSSDQQQNRDKQQQNQDKEAASSHRRSRRRSHHSTGSAEGASAVQ